MPLTLPDDAKYERSYDMKRKLKKPQYNFIPMVGMKFSMGRLAQLRIMDLETENKALRKLCGTYQRFLEKRDQIIARLKRRPRIITYRPTKMKWINRGLLQFLNSLPTIKRKQQKGKR